MREKRFAFVKNWKFYLKRSGTGKVDVAKRSLTCFVCANRRSAIFSDAMRMNFFTAVTGLVGGSPVEVTPPKQLEECLYGQDFTLTWHRLVSKRHGCDKFVFQGEISHD